MVEKKYSELLRVSPRPDEMTFTELVSGVTVEYDQALMKNETNSFLTNQHVSLLRDI